MKKIEVLEPGLRAVFEDWIKNGGGVKVWRNINLSNPGAPPIFTPALSMVEVPPENGGVNYVPYPKPSWQVDNGEVITDISRFRFVKGFKEFKRIKVALRRKSGYNYCLTDASQRKLDKAMAQAEEKYGDATFHKDGGLFDYERYIVVEIPEWEDANA